MMKESKGGYDSGALSLVVGASGFLGHALVNAMATAGVPVIAAVRGHVDSYPSLAQSGVQLYSVGDLSEYGAAAGVMAGVNVVITCAARAHVMNDDTEDPLAAYRSVNTTGTIKLARHAAAEGVKRFIYISSVKVNGESTTDNHAFAAHDTPSPADSYGISKHEAEQGLRELASETGMEVVIIRPPLVYGPSVKGNFASMIKLVEKGLPLPLGAIHNKRSLVALDNLVDLIITCIDHPAAANQIFLVSDGDDLSTTELLRGVAEAMGKPSRLIPIPAGVLKLGATLLVKKRWPNEYLAHFRSISAILRNVWAGSLR